MSLFRDPPQVRATKIFLQSQKDKNASNSINIGNYPLINVIALSKNCNKFAPISEKKNQIEENDAGTVAVEVAHRFYGLQV